MKLHLESCADFRRNAAGPADLDTRQLKVLYSLAWVGIADRISRESGLNKDFRFSFQLVLTLIVSQIRYLDLVGKFTIGRFCWRFCRQCRLFFRLCRCRLALQSLNLLL